MTQARLDGTEPEVFEARFSGAFDINEEDLGTLDGELMLVVRARVTEETKKITRTGDVKLVHVLGVREVGVVRTDSLKESLCDSLGLEKPHPQLPMQVEVEPVIESGAYAAAPGDPVDLGMTQTSVEQIGQIKKKDPVLARFIDGG